MSEESTESPHLRVNLADEERRPAVRSGVDWESFENRRIARREISLCFAWTIMEYFEGVCADNLPEDIAREAELLAGSIPTPELRKMIDDILGMRDFEVFKAFFRIDYVAVEDYVEDGDVSALEGWVFARRDDDGPFEIRKYEADPHGHFATDDEAISYVRWRASSGSEFHRAVLNAIGAGRDDPPESASSSSENKIDQAAERMERGGVW